MELVLLTALGVGGATVVGALFGMAFKNVSHKFNDMILGFASGIMLCAAVIGLILPSITEGKLSIIVTIIGIFCGAVVLNVIDKIVPHLHRLSEKDIERHSKSQNDINKLLLFVLAIAIHNFPEGIAAGVGFGTGNNSEALTIAGGIALQNIPEGMVIIAPMLAAGVGKAKTFVIAALTGVVEVIGTLLGFFAVNISTAVLPFSLAFAGGTMLYIISDEMIPETHSHGNERGATYSLLIGFSLMLVMDFFL
ncbi:MAG: ZIP family metal transporter [Clostridia bacterium]|nr:ZIP family metal transporter [Clostridia bacterium]